MGNFFEDLSKRNVYYIIINEYSDKSGVPLFIAYGPYDNKILAQGDDFHQVAFRAQKIWIHRLAKLQIKGYPMTSLDLNSFGIPVVIHEWIFIA